MTTTFHWSGKWRVTITPISEASVNFDSGGGILSQIELTLQSEGMGAFRIDLINDAGAYNSLYEIGDKVEIYLDAPTGTIGTTKRLTGFVKKVGYKRAGANNTLILSGFGYLSKFKRTLVHEIYRGSRTYEDIITNGTDGLLAKYASEVSGSGVQATGKTLGAHDTLKFDYVPLYDCLERIKGLVGDWVFEITPALVLNFNQRGYTDTGKTLEDFDDVTFEYDDEMLVNTCYMFGGKDYTSQDKSAWTGTASLNNGDAPLTYNNNLTTGWDSGAAQAATQWYQLDLGSAMIIGRMYIDNSSFAAKYPRNFRVEAQYSATSPWDLITEKVANTARDILIDFPQNEYRIIKITLTGADTNNWAIGEIYLYSYYNLIAKMANSASISKYGLYERKLMDSTVRVKSQAKARVKTEIEKYNAPIIGGEVVLSYFFDCSPNELITVTVPETPIDQKFKVERVSFSEGTYGSFQERISFRS